MSSDQLSLFSAAEIPGKWRSLEPALQMGAEALQMWEARLVPYVA